MSTQKIKFEIFPRYSCHYFQHTCALIQLQNYIHYILFFALCVQSRLNWGAAAETDIIGGQQLMQTQSGSSSWSRHNREAAAEMSESRKPACKALLRLSVRMPQTYSKNILAIATPPSSCQWATTLNPIGLCRVLPTLFSGGWLRPPTHTLLLLSWNLHALTCNVLGFQQQGKKNTWRQ